MGVGDMILPLPYVTSLSPDAGLFLGDEKLCGNLLAVRRYTLLPDTSLPALQSGDSDEVCATV